MRNANADARSSIAVCPRDRAVSGFRARIRNVRPGSVDYVEDLQFECARVIGPPLAYGARGPQAALPISDEQRAWMPFADETGDAGGCDRSRGVRDPLRCGAVDVVHDTAVLRAAQSPHHRGAHPAQSDHSQVGHGRSLAHGAT